VPKKKWEEPGERIHVYVPQSHKAELKIKLQHHGLTQASFMRGIIRAFLQEEPALMVWFDEWKLHNSKVRSNSRHKKSEKLKKAGSELAAKFGINDGELDDIFDVIAKEHPEL